MDLSPYLPVAAKAVNASFSSSFPRKLRIQKRLRLLTKLFGVGGMACVFAGHVLSQKTWPHKNEAMPGGND